ncbi:MAG: hypothetical protein K2P92_05160 [Bdellovibrionaceae bacterium]|nr:hypothetical protein [Pseudobdellovibrionaceae bacterium]
MKKIISLVCFSVCATSLIADQTVLIPYYEKDGAVEILTLLTGEDPGWFTTAKSSWVLFSRIVGEKVDTMSDAIKKIVMDEMSPQEFSAALALLSQDPNNDQEIMRWAKENMKLVTQFSAGFIFKTKTSIFALPMNGLKGSDGNDWNPRNITTGRILRKINYKTILDDAQFDGNPIAQETKDVLKNPEVLKFFKKTEEGTSYGELYTLLTQLNEQLDFTKQLIEKLK